MSDNDDAMFSELLNYLKSDRDDVREAATEAALSVSTRRKNDRTSLFRLIRTGALPHLTQLMTHPDGKIGYNSLACLVHLTSNEENESVAQAVCEEVLSSNGVRRAVEVALSFRSSQSQSEEIIETQRSHVNHAMALLSNLTRTEEGAKEFLSSSSSPGSKSSFEKVDMLFSRFLSGQYVTPSTDCTDLIVTSTNFSLQDPGEQELERPYRDGIKDPYQHFSSLLRNISQIDIGRNYMLQFSEKGQILPPRFQSILNELQSPNVYRRRGAVGIAQNCCFDKDRMKMYVLPLLSPKQMEDDENILFHLLLPLCGSEAIDDEDERIQLGASLLERIDPEKLREPDCQTRLSLVQAILLLCSSGRQIRQVLRAKGVYIVLRNADMVEEEEQISERIEECVQFLRRDEEGTEEGSSDKAAVELARKIRGGGQGLEDYDGVD